MMFLNLNLIIVLTERTISEKFRRNQFFSELWKIWKNKKNWRILKY